MVTKVKLKNQLSAREYKDGLYVHGNRIVDQKGSPVVLRGVSLIDIGGDENPLDKVAAIADEWPVNTVRFPIYPPHVDGHFSANPFPTNLSAQQDYVANRLDPLVQAAVETGLYVIIDFHQIADVIGNRELIDEASRFWTFMAPLYAENPRVIYEVYNEPINQNWQLSAKERWLEFRPLAQQWVDIIRTTSFQNLILVGGTTWSQDIGGAAQFPILGENIAYVAHIYPYNYKTNDLFEQVETCARVHPVVLTEWGYGAPEEADDIFVDTEFPVSLKEIITRCNLNWIAWCFHHEWGPPMFATAGHKKLTTFGKTVRSWLKNTP